MNAPPTLQGDGRLPHLSFRGLLSIHSRFGLPRRQIAKATLYTEDSGGFVTSTTPPVATGWNDPCRTGLAPARHPTPFQGVPRMSKSPTARNGAIAFETIVHYGGPAVKRPRRISRGADFRASGRGLQAGAASA